MKRDGAAERQVWARSWWLLCVEGLELYSDWCRESLKVTVEGGGNSQNEGPVNCPLISGGSLQEGDCTMWFQTAELAPMG